jgi:hypothetical protein
MAAITAPYDQYKIDKLRNYLEDMAQKGHARPFEIFVDNLKVVPKTDCVELFSGFDGYMDEDTEKVRIVIYDTASSPRNNQYVFQLKQPAASLNGPGSIDGIIQEKLAARDREYELGRLKEELKQTKAELEDAEAENEELRTELEKSRSNKYKLGNLDLVEFGGVVLENLAMKNSGLLGKIGLPGLGGINPEEMEIPEPVSEATFKRKSAAPAINPQHEVYLPFLESLEQAFDQQQLMLVMEILQKLTNEPQQLPEVAQLLNIETKP